MDGDLSYSPPWKNAMSVLFAAGGYTYGQLIPHDVLQKALGLPKPVERITADEHEAWRLKLLAQVDALSEALLEDRNMCLQSIPGQGYKIVEPEKQTEYAVKKGQKGLRTALMKMGRRLSFVDRAALTNDQAKENADALARLSFIESQVVRKRLIF